MDIVNEVRQHLARPYPGDERMTAILQGVPGLLLQYRLFDEVLATQVIAPFETVYPYLQQATGHDGFTMGSAVAEWQYDNGTVVHLRRLPNTVRGSPACRMRVEGATPGLAAALQEAPHKEAPRTRLENDGL